MNNNIAKFERNGKRYEVTEQTAYHHDKWDDVPEYLVWILKDNKVLWIDTFSNKAEAINWAEFS